jgi:hypothetical protein
MTATLLVISKGWMISRHQLKRKTKILQGLTTVMLCAIYGIIFTVEITERDPANTYNTYETTSARVLAVVRVLLLGWFVWCVKRSYHQEDRPRVRRFYVHFGALGAFWLGSLPVYGLIISALPSWYRLKTISALHFGTNAFTLFMLGTNMHVLIGLSVALTGPSPGQRAGRASPVMAGGVPVGSSARDSSRQQPRIPGNSGSRSVAPVTIPAPVAPPAPAPAPAKAAVELTPSASSRTDNTGSQSARAMRDDVARAEEASRREDRPTGGYIGLQGQQGQRQLPPLAPAGSELGAGALPPLDPIQGGPSRCSRIHTPSSTTFDSVH